MLTTITRITNYLMQMVMTPYFPKPDVLIYLECDYDEVIDRIQQRDVTWKSIQIQNIGENYLNGMKID